MVEPKTGVVEGKEDPEEGVEALTQADARVAGPVRDKVAERVGAQAAKDR